MAMAAAGAKLPNPWEAVGRDTEVGRALFALYNGYGVARNRGNKYSDHNRMKIMERISAQGLPDLYRIPPDLPKSKKPVVKVPRFRKKYVRIDEIPQVLLMRGRRKGSQILTQLKEDISQKDQPPQPKRPVLDEKEKARLQEIFEWSGRDVEDEDEAKSDVPMAPRKPPPPRGSVEEQEMLIEAIAMEIEERKQFLDRMFVLGRGPKYEPIIRLEIQERVRQMELLDKNISRMDKERLEGQTHNPTGPSIQSRHLSMGDERAYSRASSRSTDMNFKERLDAVRKETKALRGDTCSKTQQDDNEFAESDGDMSCSEKSFARQSIS
ncbi:unnamed protein product [Calypogeia fissa]